jgi:hypothetical protein
MPGGAPLSSRERSARYRAARKAQGLRRKEMWVPDTGQPGFWSEIQREMAAIAAADRARRAEGTPE